MSVPYSDISFLYREYNAPGPYVMPSLIRRYTDLFRGTKLSYRSSEAHAVKNRSRLALEVIIVTNNARKARRSRVLPS